MSRRKLKNAAGSHEPSVIRAKIWRFCAYQERCEAETRRRLQELGADAALTDLLLEELREDGAVNDARFARSYAGGKFRNKQWGRLKIQAGLRALGVADEYVRAALETEIDPVPYAQAASRLALRRLEEAVNDGFNGTDAYAAVHRFMQQKGFESEIVRRALEGREGAGND